MCGIFGFVNGKHFRNTSGNLCNMLSNGIMTNAVRGMDSTGVIQLDTRNVWYFKAPVSGAEFIRLPESTGYINDADNSHFTVVHNRAATEGTVTEENAHPFEHTGTKGNYVIGVHNGTLKNWKPKDSTFQVDSDWAISELAEKGVEALKEFRGAYAFVWYDDSDPGQLNFARNNERPMYVMFIKNQNRMVFASEYQMVTWLADRNHIDLEPEIIELAANYHYRFSIDNPKIFTKQLYIGTNLSNTQRSGMFGTSSPVPETDKERLFKKVRAVFALPPPAKKEEVEEAPGNPYVTSDEVRLAKANNMFKEEVEFIIEHYDETSQALWGSFTDKLGDLNCAVIRKVNKATYDIWDVASSLSTKVVGAVEHDMEGLKDLVYVVSRNVVVDTETVDGEHPMAAAIRKSMETFQKAKDEQAKQQFTHH